MGLWTRKGRKSSPEIRAGSRRYADRTLRTMQGRDLNRPVEGNSGGFIQKDYNRGLTVGTFETRGGISLDPRVKLAWHLRRSLDVALGRRKAIPRPPCIIYDANGKPIATMDPTTRERKPL